MYIIICIFNIQLFVIYIDIAIGVYVYIFYIDIFKHIYMYTYILKSANSLST